MIRAQVIKECRQLGRWALLAAILLSALLAGALYLSRSTGTTLLGPVMLLTFFSFAIGGMALGLAVTVGDLRRGHFGFAVHRPITRARLFVAKFLAATILYLIASGLCLIVVTVCARNPHFTHAPFDWSFLAPYTLAMASGVMWVACGMLIAARRARISGSRLLPMVLPAVVQILTAYLAANAFEACAVMLVMAVLLLVVGAAYFKSNGHYEKLPFWTRPLAGWVTLAGVMAVFGGAAGSLSEFLQQQFNPSPPYWGYQVRFTVEGEPYIDSRDANGVSWLYDRNYNRLTREQEAALNFTWARDVSIVYGQPRGRQSWVQRRSGARLMRPETYLTTLSNDSDNTRWFAVAARKTVEAYTARGDFAGSLGPSGSRDASAVPEPFTDINDWSPGYFGNGLYFGPTKVWSIVPSRREARVLYRSPDDQPILGATQLMMDAELDRYVYGNSSREGTRRRRYVATDDQIRRAAFRPTLFVVHPGKLIRTPLNGGAPTLTMDLPTDVDFGWLSVAAVGDNGMAMFQSIRGQAQSLVGGKVETFQLNLPPFPERPRAVWIETIKAIATPFVLMWMKWYYVTIPLTDPYTMALLAADAVAVAWTIWLVRRRGDAMASLAVWTGLAVLLGLYIPLTLLCLKRFDRRVPCPACGRRRRLGSDRCDHCGAAWPTPDLPATQVIDSALHSAA